MENSGVRYDYFIGLLLVVVLFMSFLGKSLEFFCGRNFLDAPSFEDSLGLHPWLFFDKKKVNMDRYFVRLG